MNAEQTLDATATLFLALGDKTRLRILNLLQDREVCVTTFTEALGESQPKISRHLAYLRNAGVVEVRRDGKWIYYKLSSELDLNSQRLISELFRCMEPSDGQRRQSRKTEATQPKRTTRQRSRKLETLPDSAPESYEERYEEPTGRSSSHNELEDFLL